MKYINFFFSVLYLSSTILVISCSSDEDTDGLMVSSDDTTRMTQVKIALQMIKSLQIMNFKQILIRASIPYS